MQTADFQANRNNRKPFKQHPKKNKKKKTKHRLLNLTKKPLTI